MNVAGCIRHVTDTANSWQQLIDQTVPAGNRGGGDIHHVIRLQAEFCRHHQRRRIGHIQLVDIGNLAITPALAFQRTNDKDAAGVGGGHVDTFGIARGLQSGSCR